MIILDFITISLISILIYCYQTDKINVVELVLLSFSMSTYHLSIGPTLNSFFFILIYLSIIELNWILINKPRFTVKTFLFITLPIISIFVSFLSLIILPNIYEFKNNEQINVLTNGLYFLIKYYYPLLITGHRIQRYRSNINIENTYLFIKKISFYSLIIATIQLTVHSLYPNPYLDQILGMDYSYNYIINNINLKRINAFFYEPKYLGGFLSCAFPLFIRDKNYIKLVYLFIIGLLTLSHTFIIGVVVYFIVLLIKKISYKYNILIIGSTILIILSFNFIYFSIEKISEKELFGNKIPIINMLIDRGLERFDSDNEYGGNIFLGIPFQADLEGPVLDFFKHNPFLIFFGYGPGNATLVPDLYFKNIEKTYQARLKGFQKGHINMGWIFWIFELGLIISIIFIFLLRVSHINHFDIFYYSFLMIFLLFFRHEILIVIFYILNQQGKKQLS